MANKGSTDILEIKVVGSADMSAMITQITQAVTAVGELTKIVGQLSGALQSVSSGNLDQLKNSLTTIAPLAERTAEAEKERTAAADKASKAAREAENIRRYGQQRVAAAGQQTQQLQQPPQRRGGGITDRISVAMEREKLQAAVLPIAQGLSTNERSKLLRGLGRSEGGITEIKRRVSNVLGFTDEFTNNLLQRFNFNELTQLLEGKPATALGKRNLATAQKQLDAVQKSTLAKQQADLAFLNQQLTTIPQTFSKLRDLTTVMPLNQAQQLVDRFEKVARTGKGSRTLLKTIDTELSQMGYSPKEVREVKSSLRQALMSKEYAGGVAQYIAEPVQKAQQNIINQANSKIFDEMMTTTVKSARFLSQSRLSQAGMNDLIQSISQATGKSQADIFRTLKTQFRTKGGVFDTEGFKTFYSDLAQQRQQFIEAAEQPQRPSFMRRTFGRLTGRPTISPTPEMVLQGIPNLEALAAGIPPGGGRIGGGAGGGGRGGGRGGFFGSLVGGDRAGGMLTRIASVAEYAVAAQAVGGAFAAFGGAIKTVKDVDTAITQLNKVLGTSKKNMDDLKKSAISTAKEFGLGITDVLKGYQIFAQQGLPIGEIKKRGAVVAKAANVSELSTEELSEVVTAGLLNFGKDVKNNGEALIDSFLAVEQANAVTEKDLAEVMQRIGAGAAASGMSLHELNAVATIIKERTREAPNVIATSLRFFLKNLYDPKVMKALNQELKIEFKTPGGDLKTPFRLLSEMANLFPNLNKEQQRNLALQIGETRNMNRFTALMNGFGKATDIVATSQNSFGTSNERNAIIMGSLQKQLDKTKASFQALALSIGDNLIGPTSSFLALVTAATDKMSAWSSVKVPVLDEMSNMIQRGAGVAKGERTPYTFGDIASSTGLGFLLSKTIMRGISPTGILGAGIGGLAGLTVGAPTLGAGMGYAGGQTVGKFGLDYYLMGEATKRIPQILDKILGTETTFNMLQRTGVVTKRQTGADLQTFGTQVLDEFIVKRRGLTEEFNKAAEMLPEEQIKTVGRTTTDIQGELVDQKEAFIKSLVSNQAVFNALTRKGMEIRGNEVFYPLTTGGIRRRPTNVLATEESQKQFAEEVNRIQKTLGGESKFTTLVANMTDELAKQGDDFQEYQNVLTNYVEAPERGLKNIKSKRRKAFVEQELRTGNITNQLLEPIFAALQGGQQTDVSKLLQTLPKERLQQILPLLSAQSKEVRQNIVGLAGSTAVAPYLEDKYRYQIGGLAGRYLPKTVFGTPTLNETELAQLMKLDPKKYREQLKKQPEELIKALEQPALAKEVANGIALNFYNNLGKSFANIGRDVLPKNLQAFEKTATEQFKQTADIGNRVRAINAAGKEVFGLVGPNGMIRVLEQTTRHQDGIKKTLIKESEIPVVNFFKEYKDIFLDREKRYFAEITSGYSKDFIDIGFGAGTSFKESGLKLGAKSLLDMSSLTAGTFTGMVGGRPTFNLALQRVFLALAEEQKNAIKEAKTELPSGTGAEPGAGEPTKPLAPEEEASKRRETAIAEKTSAMQRAGIGLIAQVVEGFGKVIQTLQAGADEFKNLIHTKAAKALIPIVPGLEPRVTVKTRLGEFQQAGFANVPTVATQERELNAQQLANIRMPKIFQAAEYLFVQRKTEQQALQVAFDKQTEAMEAIKSAPPEAIYQLNLKSLEDILVKGDEKAASELGVYSDTILNSLSKPINTLTLNDEQLREAEKKRAELQSSLGKFNISDQIKQQGKLTESQAQQYNEVIKGATALAELEISARAAADSLEIISRTKAGTTFRNLERSIGGGAFGLLGQERAPILFSREQERLSLLDFTKENQFEQQRRMIQLLSSPEVTRGRRQIISETGEVIQPINQQQAKFQLGVLDIRERRAKIGEREEAGKAVIQETIQQGKSLQATLTKFLITGQGNEEQRNAVTQALSKIEQLGQINPKNVFSRTGELATNFNSNFKSIVGSLQSGFKDITQIPAGLLNTTDIDRLFGAGVLKEDQAQALKTEIAKTDPNYQVAVKSDAKLGSIDSNVRDISSKMDRQGGKEISNLKTTAKVNIPEDQIKSIKQVTPIVPNIVDIKPIQQNETTLASTLAPQEQVASIKEKRPGYRSISAFEGKLTSGYIPGGSFSISDRFPSPQIGASPIVERQDLEKQEPNTFFSANGRVVPVPKYLGKELFGPESFGRELRGETRLQKPVENLEPLFTGGNIIQVPKLNTSNLVEDTRIRNIQNNNIQDGNKEIKLDGAEKVDSGGDKMLQASDMLFNAAQQISKALGGAGGVGGRMTTDNDLLTNFIDQYSRDSEENSAAVEELQTNFEELNTKLQEFSTGNPNINIKDIESIVKDIAQDAKTIAEDALQDARDIKSKINLAGLTEWQSKIDEALSTAKNAFRIASSNTK